MNRRLPRSFYNRPTLEVARDLLGRRLIYRTANGRLVARIVEVEAYIGQDDPACHAAPGPTDRNRVMFGKAGFSYVYFIYGMYYCLNFVTEREGFPAAILVRAAEPLEGVELMRKNSPGGATATLLSGPGKLCRAFGLTTEHSGLDLVKSDLFVAGEPDSRFEVACTRRIGIRKGAELPYRFHIVGSPAISGPKRRQTPPAARSKF